MVNQKATAGVPLDQRFERRGDNRTRTAVGSESHDILYPDSTVSTPLLGQLRCVGLAAPNRQTRPGATREHRQRHDRCARDDIADPRSARMNIPWRLHCI